MQINFLCDPSFIVTANTVCGKHPSLSFSDILFHGYTRKGESIYAAALKQHINVCVFPFSPEVIDHTFFLPSSVITLPGLCTTVTSDSHLH